MRSTTTALLQPTSCSGEKLPPKPDGTSWACSFDDEFSSATGDANSLNTAVWLPQLTSNSDFTSGVAPYQVCYVNSPNNISVSSGALHLTVRKEAAPFSCGGLFNTQYTGGMVSSIYGFSQEYGRFEARALLPQTTIAGLQEALWMWPVNDTLYGSWPASGEIDFSEFYSYESSLDIPYIHYNYDSSTVDSATNTNIVTNYCSIPLHQYNAYAVTWSPGNITVTINGKTCLIDNYVPNNGLTSPAPFNQPFFISLTQELGVPYNGNGFDPSTTPLPATLSVDYVRVWK